MAATTETQVTDERPFASAVRYVAVWLNTGATVAEAKAAQPTFPGRMPMLRIDHVFVSGGIEVMRAEPIRSPLARAASDHLPLLAEAAGEWQRDLVRAGLRVAKLGRSSVRYEIGLYREDDP